MEWETVFHDLFGAVIAGVFAPPIIAAIASMNEKTRVWIRRPQVAAILMAVPVATLTSIFIWLMLPQRPDGKRTALEYVATFDYQLIQSRRQLDFSLDQSRFGSGCGKEPPVALVNISGSGFHGLTFVPNVVQSPVNRQWKGSILTNQAPSTGGIYDMQVYLLSSCD